MVLPEPVWPISAIVRPAGTSSVTPSSTGRPGEVLEADVLEAQVARRPAAARPRPGRSAISSGSSITWKIRSPEAVARCAWPIHIPSERSGTTSMPR